MADQRADLDELARLLAWQPRETAPEDGTVIWVRGPSLVHEDFTPDGIVEACFDGERFIGAVWDGQHDVWRTDFIEFTEWLPRNALPALLATAREMALAADWCNDGETPAERIQRERDDSLALMELLAREKQAHEATARRERRMREGVHNLLKRVRPNTEAAAWVVAELAALAEEGQDG